MTNQEAIKWFKESPFYHPEHEPVKMAIEALKAEPCKDDPRADIYYLAEKIGIHRLYQLVTALRGEPEMQHCCNCGRTANNGGLYKDGRTRCPIEEHYQLPIDGYCHLWEKRNVTDDDYPEREVVRNDRR